MPARSEGGGERVVVRARVAAGVDEQDPQRRGSGRARMPRSYPGRDGADRPVLWENMADVRGAEQEIDLRGYADRVITRWWVVAICVIAAVALSYALSGTEDRKLTRAASTVFLGQPVTPNGALVPNPLSANPLYAAALARQPAYQGPAAEAAGLAPDALKGHVSVELISTAVGTKGTAVPLVQVIVQGPFTPAQSADAANALSEAIVAEANRYTDAKREDAVAARDALASRIEGLAADAQATRARLDELATLDLAPAERSSLTTPLIAMLQYDSNTEALLAEQLPDLQARVQYIEEVESGRVITPAKGTKVAPASRQFSLLVAIVLGLVVGILAAVISTVFWPQRPALDNDALAAP